MSIGEAIRALRKRLKKNQAEFGRLLGCEQNTISRYELGKFTPNPLVLLQLQNLAGPEERTIFAAELKRQWDQGLIGHSSTVTLEEWGEVCRKFMGEFRIGEVLLHALAERNKLRPDFRRFIVAVAHLIEVSKSVDDSVIGMLELWAYHGSNERAVHRFRDALGFLRVQCWQLIKPSSPGTEGPDSSTNGPSV
jgi:transcriptional regulator with XRE-family HTH domain